MLLGVPSDAVSWIWRPDWRATSPDGDVSAPAFTTVGAKNIRNPLAALVRLAPASHLNRALRDRLVLAAADRLGGEGIDHARSHGRLLGISEQAEVQEFGITLGNGYRLARSQRPWPTSRLVATREPTFTCEAPPNRIPLALSTRTVPGALIAPRIWLGAGASIGSRMPVDGSSCPTTRLSTIQLG